MPNTRVNRLSARFTPGAEHLQGPTARKGFTERFDPRNNMRYRNGFHNPNQATTGGTRRIGGMAVRANYHYDDPVANTYVLTRGKQKVTVYYQPVISTSAFYNQIFAFRTNGTTNTGRYFEDNFYSPDFILKFSSGDSFQGDDDYVIIDAKFARSSNVIDFYIDDLIKKYSTNTAIAVLRRTQVLRDEDDEDIVELLSLYLTGEGFTVFSAGNGFQALELLDSVKIDIAILDIMMPEMSGYDLLKKIREAHNFPVIILSAKDLDTDRILGLNLGADAYLTKPFNPLEVVAYVKSALRRYCELGSNNDSEKSEGEKPSLTVGELQLDLFKFILRKRGRVVPLTPTELKIVLKLMQSPGRVYTKAQLYACIGGELYESDDNTMMVHISNIRAKIEDDPSNPRYIKTVRGLGYKIEEN